ncbi:ubiquinol oxidase subunit II [Candidatus Liberibacter americanus]|uniref:Ubiquinol oxidase subunit 2 n=1 Tax=Candidatus Liberibacter americanus str. Sao Paulo TaxID=1261131 RepID=U6B347_9HYPH|nr:ubiquinol oxidase subunit II [Candidatus Liberibacter americanus]AHA27484.1 Heme/copper-type cytochrome/quinol oxidase, subunit 2 [Candidatus Liberibacter americanus str. Sao Paulo]EMS36554.1 ubiquinol oxidase, subunit II [Candidatus Liberibacter americanus PW_SP]
MGKYLKNVIALFPTLIISSCDFIVMNPQGYVAVQQADLIRVSVFLMLLIVIPVFVAILFYARKYRVSNKKAIYDSEWCHSTKLEIVIWGFPLLIVICLAIIAWDSTHRLDPYVPLKKISETQAVPEGIKPLVIEVVALDWKWLFLFPEQKIAVVNELVVPVNRPLQFKITSTSVMNSFYIPCLAGQIYSMAGMETKLHAVINQEASCSGFSANYSGRGFSHMRFKFYGKSQSGFDDWITMIRSQGDNLDYKRYLLLEKPSENDPVIYFSSVKSGLYKSVLNLCFRHDKICMDQIMKIDALGGGGINGVSRYSIDYYRH